MDASGSRLAIAQGAPVFAADGSELGTVARVEADRVVVTVGTFFPTEYVVPLAAVAKAAPERVDLDVTREVALGRPGGAPTGDLAGGEATAETAAPAEARRDERVVVPVYEEDVSATTTATERGAVRIEKQVVAEERTVEIPVTQERLRITRHAVDRPLAEGEVAFEPETIAVPLRGERVELQTQARVVGEVVIQKEAEQRTAEVRETVRREEVRVVDEVAGGAAGVVAEGVAVVEPGAVPPAAAREQER